MEVRKQWGFSTAGELVFGVDALKRLGKVVAKLGCKNPLIVSDPGVKEAGLLAKTLQVLDISGICYGVFDRGEPEPSLEVVLSAYEWAQGGNHDSVIAVGGGSVIDLGKVLACLLAFGGSLSDYFGEGRLPGRPLPLVAVSTTSGTGSEVSPASILTDRQANLKRGISDNRLRPAVALVDPVMTLSCPPFVTACTGMDVLAHAVEAFMATPYAYLPLNPGEEDTVLYHGSNPLSDCLACDAIRLAGENLRLAVDQGSNLEARTQMALANIMAGMAFSNAGVTAAHAMAYPVGAITHAPHGLVVGLLLPHVMEYNLPVSIGRLHRIADCLGADTRMKSAKEIAWLPIDSVREMMADVGLPSRMRDIGVKEGDLRPMAEATIGITRLLRSNPRRVTVGDIEAIYRKAY
jgi:alcohol dehydrogenase class IV